MKSLDLFLCSLVFTGTLYFSTQHLHNISTFTMTYIKIRSVKNFVTILENLNFINSFRLNLALQTISNSKTLGRNYDMRYLKADHLKRRQIPDCMLIQDTRVLLQIWLQRPTKGTLPKLKVQKFNRTGQNSQFFEFNRSS